MATATAMLSGHRLAERIQGGVSDAVEYADDRWAVIQAEKLLETAQFLHDDAELDGQYLIAVTGLDRYDHFEVVYQVASLAHNHEMTFKVRADHENPTVPSVVPVWRGAHLQEREAYDLLGIRFSGHPDLKRIFLWDGFPGHPLRKDFMRMPGGVSPGLQRFPKEDSEQWGGEFRGD